MGQVYCCGGAHLLCYVQPVIIYVGHYYVARAVLAADANGHHAYGACAGYEHVLAHNVEHCGGVRGVAVCVKEGNYILRNIVRHKYNIGLGYAYVFRKRALPVHAHALGLLAPLAVARAAVAAMAAYYVPFAGNDLADFIFSDARAKRGDFANVFVAYYHGRIDMLLAPRVPIVNMHIRAAYGGFVYFDKHLAYSRLWNGYLGKNKSFCTLRFNKRIHHFLHTITLAINYFVDVLPRCPRCTDILYGFIRLKSMPYINKRPNTTKMLL